VITTPDTRQREGPESRRSPLASGSIIEHLLRGAVGLIAAVLAIALFAGVGPVSLALLPLTALAWRGCPTCWTVGLFGTLADGRARRSYCTAECRCRQAGRDASFQLED
jgi:hypothetical protein